MIQPNRPRLRGLALMCLALCTSAPLCAQDAKQALQAIEKELQDEYKLLREATHNAADDDAADALYRAFQEEILPDFAARFAALAQANKGSEVGLSAWMKVLDLAQQGFTGAVGGEALKALTSDYLQSEKLAEVVGSLRYCTPSLGEETVTGALRLIATSSPHRSAKAAALYNLGAVLGEDRPANDPKLVEAKTVLAQLADYKDVEYFGGRSYAEAAASFLFALENLVSGKPCPDFKALDAEGAAFKLSDYKGKVVLVDFWGFW